MRDGARHLPACIASLRSQTLVGVEFVVVDDGSTDATPRLLRDWAREDPRVRVLRQTLQGLVPALERARAAAAGDVLARMDHDDVALPERLAAQLRLLEARSAVVLCGCRVEYVSGHRITDGARRYQAWLNGLVEPETIERDLFVECPLAHPTFMVRAAALEAVGGYRHRGWPEDYDLVLRLWEAGGRFAKVPRVLLRWRDRPDRLSRTSSIYDPAAFRRCKIAALGRTLLRDREGVVVWGAGPTGKAFARALKREGRDVRAFVELDPRKIGQEIHGAPVVDPGGLAAYRDAFCVAAVGREGARDEIRRDLTSMGWREMVDFCAVA